MALKSSLVSQASTVQTTKVQLSILAEGVDRELTCAICLNQYKDPKVLPCLHTYCKGCLEQLIMAAAKPNKHQLTCPQCKEIHQVPPEGINSFKTYFIINNLLELLHIHKSSDEDLSSGATLCESGLDKNPAVARCLTCSEYLCKGCFAIHQQLKLTRDHSMLTLEKIKHFDRSSGIKNVQRRQYCEEHKSEDLKLFCTTCEKVICRDCALVKHREHDYAFITEACCDVQKTLESLLKAVKGKENEFQVNKKHIEDFQKASRDVLYSCLKETNTACDQLVEAIEARRAFLVAKLHSIHEVMQVELKMKLNDVEHSLARLSDSIHFTEKLLSDNDDIEMMTIGIQARSTLKGMSWNKESVKPMLLRVKFPPQTLKTFGKVLNTVQSNEIFIENIPQDVFINKEMQFIIRLSDEISTRRYDATSLLSVKIMHNSHSSAYLPVTIKGVDLNKWVVSVTPTQVGQHDVQVKVGKLAQHSQQFLAIRETASSHSQAVSMFGLTTSVKRKQQTGSSKHNPLVSSKSKLNVCNPRPHASGVSFGTVQVTSSDLSKKRVFNLAQTCTNHRLDSSDASCTSLGHSSSFLNSQSIGDARQRHTNSGMSFEQQRKRRQTVYPSAK